MAEITDVTVLDGDLTFDRPRVVLDALTAQAALDRGELPDLVQKALSALELSGKSVVYVQEESA